MFNFFLQMMKHVYKPFNGSKTKFYSKLNGNKCAAILTINLAYPEWVTIDCDEPITAHTLCEFSYNSFDNQSEPIETHPDSSLYSKLCILVNHQCYIFSWSSAENVKLFKYGEITRPADINLTLFQHVFDAVNVDYPPILSTDLIHFVLYKRYSIIPHLKRQILRESSFQGLYIHHTSFMERIQGGNLFQCKSTGFISIKFICDGTDDCPDANPSDETGCTCQPNSNYTSECKFIENTVNPEDNPYCSLFKTQLQGNTCGIYMSISAFCFHHKSITIYIKNQKETELKLPFITMDKKNSSTSSCKKAKLPCNLGNSQCFSIFEICSYKINSQHKIYPCENGRHLEHCTEFECNMMFKCPGYYCIPWGYICDGKWDCPEGYDELILHKCNSRRQCLNMFKCRNCQICIHFGDVCDGTTNCPFGDDEHLCGLNAIRCPKHCQCLAYSVMCQNAITLKIGVLSRLPHHLVSMRQCVSIFVKVMLKMISYVTVLDLKFNQISVIYESFFPSLNYSLLIDIGYNSIRKIESGCFSNLYYLSIIKLNNNLLSQIAPRSFTNLHALKTLDLSNNYLLIFTSDIISNSVNLKIINLTNSRLTITKDNLYLNFIEAKTLFIISGPDPMCCFLHCSSGTTAVKFSRRSCSNMLTKGNIKITFRFVSVAVIMLLLLCFVLQNTLVKSGAYTYIISSVCFCDAILAVYLITIWVNDLIYDDNFPLEASKWKSSIVCFTAFAFTLTFHLISPLILCFLSFSRLMVVLFPLDNILKNKQIAIRFVTCTMGFIIIFVLLVTTIIWKFYDQVPFKLCSPLIDSTHSVWLINTLSWIVVCLQICATCFIPSVYVMLIRKLLKCQSNFYKGNLDNKSNHILFTQIIFLISSNILCWVPSSIIYIFYIYTPTFPTMLAEWAIIVIVPINSVMNPLVFTAGLVRKIIQNVVNDTLFTTFFGQTKTKTSEVHKTRQQRYS